MTENKHYQIESNTLFSESLIWQINRDYYQETGIDAWSSGVVPHNMTSNSFTGKIYAVLIIGFLQDLASKGQITDTVYIIELGAGHGRLAFHILKHLEKLERLLQLELPPYCYVLSDIVEENLSFFENHSQFQTYLEKGILDVSYFDAIKGDTLNLRYTKKKINPQDLNQPLIAIANYFFDSIPNDLFLVQNQQISSCSIALETSDDPKDMNTATLLKQLELVYDKQVLTEPFYKETISENILNDYKSLINDSHIFFPKKSLECLANLQKLSTKGLMVLSMDKGFFEIHDLEKRGEPEIITHGSFSLWVNYHALGAYCKQQGGKVLYPSFSDFYLQIGCLMFLPDSENYKATNIAYQRFVNDFGPDDFNGIKRLSYENISRLNLKELIALIRLSAYDSNFFVKIMPKLKRLLQQVSFNERNRFAQTMHQVWNMYFAINEPIDLAYEMGGIFYDLGYYKEAIVYFKYSVDEYGEKADIYYNKALAHYQLREDQLFADTLKKAKLAFPDYKKFEHLDTLDLNAK